MNCRISKLHIGRSGKAEEDSTTLFPPALIGLVVVAVSLRVGLSFALPRVIKWDEPMYLLLGYNLLSGNGFTYHTYPELTFPPLYPVIAGLFHLLIGDFEKASNLAYALFGGLLVFPVFALARRIYGLQTAWLAAVLLALFPALNVNVLYWGSMTEPLYLFLIYGGLAVLLAGLEDNRLGMFAAAGMLFGLAYLTRPEAVAYFGLFGLLALGWLAKDMGLRSFRPWSAVGLFVLSFTLLAAPYIGYLHAQTGQWMISGKTNMAWKASGDNGGSGGWMAYDQLTNGLDSSGTEIYWLSPDRFKVNTLRTALADPDSLLRRVIAGGRSLKDQFFERTHFWWGLTPLVVIALFKTPWGWRRIRHEAFLVTIIVALLVVFLPFGVLMRYFVPAFPVLLIWTAQGAQDMGVWLQDTLALWRGKSLSSGHLKSMLRWLPAAMVVGFLILTIPVAAQGWIGVTAFGDKAVGLWLKAHTPANAKVMTQEIGVALYAERRYVPSPHTDWARFMKYARDHEANYLVVRDFKLAEYRPQLAFLLESGAPELELVFTFEEPLSYGSVKAKTFVYHILPRIAQAEQ